MNIFKAGDKVVRTGSSGCFITRGQECIVEEAKGRTITLRGIRHTYGRHVEYLAQEFELAAPTLIPRKHQKEIIAWANGATIQYWASSDEVWYDTLDKPLWKETLRYRVKPDADSTAEVEAEIAKLEAKIDNLKKDL
jgi:hypothetical protein